ncbi:MAG: PIN domain-containing protein [Capsulimonadaceae bacterium]
MQRALLDTDIISEIIKQINPVVATNARNYLAVHERYTLTAVTVHEIIYGLVRKGALRQLQNALAAFAMNEVLVPTLDDYKLAGETRGRATGQGQQLQMSDCLIAAVAFRLRLPIVTGNTGHFQAVQAAGLSITLENWRNP